MPNPQGEDLAKALGRANTSVDFVTLKGEDHCPSRSVSRPQMLLSAVECLEAHNPPG